MQGSDEERAAYMEKIVGMIAADIEQRRAQRLAEFQASKEQKAIIVGVTGADTLMGAVTDDNIAS